MPPRALHNALSSLRAELRGGRSIISFLVTNMHEYKGDSETQIVSEPLLCTGDQVDCVTHRFRLICIILNSEIRIFNEYFDETKY